MGVVEAVRAAWRRSILENPTTITIERTERLDRGGYYENVASTVGPFVVRLFQHGRRSPVVVSDRAGEKHIEPQWGLIADHTADIRAGPDVTDEFTAQGGRWRVTAVYPRYIAGQLVGIRADVERVT